MQRSYPFQTYNKHWEKEMVITGLREIYTSFLSLESFMTNILSFPGMYSFSNSTLSRLLRGNISLTDTRFQKLKEYVLAILQPEEYLKKIIRNYPSSSPLEKVYSFLHNPLTVEFFVFLIYSEVKSQNFDYILTMYEAIPLANELSKHLGIPFFELHQRPPLFDNKEEGGLERQKFLEIPYRISGERVSSYWIYTKDFKKINARCLILLDYIRQGYLIEVFSDILLEFQAQGYYYILVGMGKQWEQQLKIHQDNYRIFHQY